MIIHYSELERTNKKNEVRGWRKTACGLHSDWIHLCTDKNAITCKNCLKSLTKKNNHMNYSGVTSRFMFWNGKEQYTVEFSHGLSMWFVFNNEEQSNCVYKKDKEKRSDKSINIISAREILDKFLEKQNI